MISRLMSFLENFIGFNLIFLQFIFSPWESIGMVSVLRGQNTEVWIRLQKNRTKHKKCKIKLGCSDSFVHSTSVSPPQSIMLYSLGPSSGQQSYSLLSKSCQQNAGSMRKMHTWRWHDTLEVRRQQHSHKRKGRICPKSTKTGQIILYLLFLENIYSEGRMDG